MRLLQCTLFIVPSATFQEETVNIGTILCRLVGVYLVIQYLEIELNQINGNGVLPCIVLLDSREETLREVKSRDPVVGWLSMLDPVTDELESLDKVSDV
jgi:hypothetical protein